MTQDANDDQMNKTEDYRQEQEYIPLLLALWVLGFAMVDWLLVSGMNYLIVLPVKVG